MGKHVCFTVADRSYFAILKKEIHAIAVKGGFSGTKLGEVDIIVAEMVSNLVKHAGGGRLLVKLVEEQHIDGIEFISIDDGDGIADVTKMMTDGASTTNTLGHGLGAIRHALRRRRSREDAAHRHSRLREIGRHRRSLLRQTV